jgi:Ca2+-binding RTX toxin-like protein
MPVFNHVATISTGPHLQGIGALEIVWINGVAKLYVGSTADGGMSVYTVGTGVATYLEQIGYAANRGTAGICDIDVVTVQGQPILIPSGRFDDRVAFHQLGTDGGFDGLSILGASPSLIGNLQDSVTLQVAGKTFMVSSQWGKSGFQAYQIRDDLSLEHKKTFADTAATHAGDITAITSATVAGRSYFFVASALDAGVTCYWMGQWGNIKIRGSIGANDGLGIAAPTALETATVDGKLYLILGSAGSGTISVLRVNNWGSLFIEDHRLDDLNTRFEGVQALEVFSVGNRSFLLAGGSDDGLSLFEINPGGRLSHIESIADQINTTLQDISAITATVVGSTVQVFVAGSETGFTQFTIDLGNIGNARFGTDQDDNITGNSKDELIFGKDGNDILNGGGGNDRIIDGAGVDRMTGGSGNDVFVFIDDGRMDYIMDFTPGKDKIDLSDFSMLYSFGQLQMVQKDYGILLTIGDDRFQIQSDTHQLLIAELTADQFIFA